MWLDYVKQKEEGKGVENFRRRGEGAWMCEIGKQENPIAKELALIKKSNFRGKHHYRLHNSKPLQVTMRMKQWRCSMKNLRKLWTRNPVDITF